MISYSPRAKKSLGQHFLKCRWVVDEMIRAADISPNDTILEIGPGTGALTFQLSQRAANVIAVEKDERLAASLQQSAQAHGIKNLEIVTADILIILKSHFNRYDAVVGNIPYYLTSRLVRFLLERQEKPNRIVFTIQKEVAERMTAQPPHMNLLALSVQAFGKPEIIKKVPASCFSPKPKVDSAIIKISDISDRYFQERSIDRDFFFKIIRTAFQGKRKLLTTTLSKLFNKKKILEALARAKLIPTSRPEELSLTQWASFLKSLQDRA